MSDQTSEAVVEGWITSGAAMLGIPMRTEWRPAIRMHLEVTLCHARDVMSFPLPDEANPAPIFQA
jgi:Protein of unknown function (DUF4089)